MFQSPVGVRNMIEVLPISGCRYIAATPECCGFTSIFAVSAYTLRKVASGLTWQGPEDFALCVTRIQDEKRCAEALSIPVMYAPLDGFIAQRDVFTQEMVSSFPCVPAHQITVEQRGGMRAWYDAEAARLKTKNPALSQWLERMRAVIEKSIPRESKPSYSLSPK